MIAITGGGTGGHLVIAKAIKEELIKRGIKPIYIGSESGQDKQWFEHDTEFEKAYFLPSRGVVDKRGLQKLLSLKQTISLAFECKKIFKKHQIQAVFSVGGYSAAPAAFGAVLSKIPLYIHEQNAITGKLNALLKPFSKAFFSSYDTANAIHTDYPIREAFFEHQRIRKELKSILFLGGSQGASFINQLAIQMAPWLHQQGIHILHQTGSKEFEMVSNFYQTSHIPAHVFAFSNEMPLLLEKADVAISRSGASTLWELCANALPAIFIPFPYAAKNHQFFNAKILADKHLALIEPQNSADAKEICDTLQTMNLEKMSFGLSHMIHKGGAKTIVDYILKALKET